MQSQSIEIKPEFKVHEILAVCLHFYNKNYYLSQIDDRMFKFNHVNKIEDSYASEYTLNHEVYENNNNYEFKFTNTKSYKSNTPTAKIVFLYGDLFVSFHHRFDRLSWENYILRNSSITTNTKTVEYIDEQDKYLKEQNKIVNQIEYMVENREFISKPLNESYNYRSSPVQTFSYIYDFRKYMDNIKKFQKKGFFNFELLSELVDCIENDAQDSIDYTMKILKFRKNNHRSFYVTLHKKFVITILLSYLREDIKNKNVPDTGFHVILPIFEELGGVDALRMLILQHRILTE